MILLKLINNEYKFIFNDMSIIKVGNLILKIICNIQEEGILYYQEDGLIDFLIKIPFL